MDITTIPAEEVLFAEIMASGTKVEEQHHPRQSGVEVEMRRKRRDWWTDKPRPLSMNVLPSSTEGPSGSPAKAASYRQRFNSALGRGLPFSKPKAFFSSEQHLPDRVEGYNRGHEKLYQLRIHSASEEDIYSGLLKFHYSDGLDRFSENLHVNSSSTVSDLLPELITRFLPHEYQLDAVDGTQPSSISLVQGQMERELEAEEKPLEIALDCSAQGLASPKFFFKSSLPPNSFPLTPRRSSHLGECPMDYDLNLSQPEHHNSMTSFGSALSIASSKSSKSKSTSSLVNIKMGGKKSNQSKEEGGTSLSSPTHLKVSGSTQQQETPTSTRKISISKAAVTNFITRSLRVRRKSKQTPATAPSTSTPPNDSPPTSMIQDSFEDKEEKEDIALTSSLFSPRVAVEKKFTLSTVIHIYSMEGKQAQVYKSVLVSEKATTLEVIAQALERYNMKSKDPKDYALFDVIGKWQNMSSTIHSQMSYQAAGTSSGVTSTLPNFNILNASPLIRRHAAVEEFVVCYCRELGPKETPYNIQFYLTPQEGFTRRFELRSKGNLNPMRGVSHEKSHSVDIMETPDDVTPTPNHLNVEEEDDYGIFGNTYQRKRARKNRIFNQSVDSADPDTHITILEHPPSPTAADDNKKPEIRTRIHSKISTGRGNGATEQDSEIPISINVTNAPDFAGLMCSSPDSGVEFHKGTHRQTNSTKSSVSSDQSDTPNVSSHDDSIALYSASLGSAFLLSLHLQDLGKEYLVHKLSSESTELSGSFTCNEANSAPSRDTVYLHHSDFSEMVNPLCCICHQPIADPNLSNRNELKSEYVLKRRNPNLLITLNQQEVAQSATLRHGDLVGVGNIYLFMFQDYKSLGSNHIPEYSWRPHPVAQVTIPKESAKRSSNPKENIDQVLKNGRDSSLAGIARSNDNVKTFAVVRREGLKEGSGHSDHFKASNAAHKKVRRVSCQIINVQDPEKLSPGSGTSNESLESPASPYKKKTENDKKNPHRNLGKTQSLPLPRDRKLVFSFKPSEEERLLSYAISSESSSSCPFKLAPAYILAMCTEYCVMSSGAEAALRFIQKTTDRIQEVLWEFTKKVTAWEPNLEMPQKPLLCIKDLFPLLEPVIFWLANTLEYYNFLVTHSTSFQLPSHPHGTGDREENEDDPVAMLYSILVYTFQQAFFPVSKVLYQSLPLMLESCVEEDVQERRGTKPKVIGEAVEFLQTLLDMLTEQHLHLEVISQFYANIFFFVNATMFNSLLEQGGDLGLYQYYCGTVLRENLNLLEGWACQVGFKDVVLHYLAKFSGAIDLLATPTEKLLQLNWSALCHEFPVLHPSQLHYLLSQYLLPISITEVPKHWTPSKEDALHALTGGSLQESFDNHPGFKFPTSSYALDLNQPPSESSHFQDTLEQLHTNLRKTDTSKNGLPTKVEAVSVAVLNGGGRSMTQGTVAGIGSHTESEEDLLAKSEVHKNHKNLEKSFRYSQSLSNGTTQKIMDSFLYQNGNIELPSAGCIGRVRSVLSARSFATPEKLILEPEPDSRIHLESVAGALASSGRAKTFPQGSRTVTIPRGDKGFGFIMVEKKDEGSEESLIVVQQVLPGSTAAACHQLKVGDQILAIDEQLLDGADYLIAERYMKEAEDDITLTLGPSKTL